MPSLDDLDPVFQAAGQEWNVDPMLLKAMAKQESGGKLDAVSKAGARGLMQIMPDTGKALGITDLHDPVQSIWGAAKYMNRALDKEGSVEGALLNYHGGDGWRSAYGPESQAYVPAIAAHYKALTGARQPDRGGVPEAPPTTSQTAQAPGGDMPISQPSARPPLVTGDSLASPGGLGGSGVVGASPKAILAAVQALPDDSVRGRDVVLSGGASNDAAGADLVEQQIKALKDKNAGTITIVGVGDAPKLKGVNEKLQDIAARSGARFVPLDPAQLGPDRVHPTGTGYKKLRTQLALR